MIIKMRQQARKFHNLRAKTVLEMWRGALQLKVERNNIMEARLADNSCGQRIPRSSLY